MADTRVKASNRRTSMRRQRAGARLPGRWPGVHAPHRHAGDGVLARACLCERPRESRNSRELLPSQMWMSLSRSRLALVLLATNQRSSSTTPGERVQGATGGWVGGWVRQGAGWGGDKQRAGSRRRPHGAVPGAFMGGGGGGRAMCTPLSFVQQAVAVVAGNVVEEG